VNIQKHGEDVQIKLSPMLTVMSKELLKPVTKNLEQTQDMELPNIYPFLSHAGWVEGNIYKKDDRFGKNILIFFA